VRILKKSKKTSCNEHKKCKDCGKEIKIGTILNIFGHSASGLWHIQFDNGEIAHLESGYGARALADAFGSLDNAIGRKVQYSTNWQGILEGFTPLDVGG